jgi:hypothetical protein
MPRDLLPGGGRRAAARSSRAPALPAEAPPNGRRIRVGVDPRAILTGCRVLAVSWLGYWLPRLTDAERRQKVFPVPGT